MKIFGIILLVFLLCSCAQATMERNKSQILGEWYPLDGENLKGYHFMENNLCENHLGYYDRYYTPENERSDEFVNFDKEDNKWYIRFDERTIVNYQGNTTSYEVNKDSLRIYDLSQKAFINHKIKFLKNDTMLLSSNNGSLVSKYVRRNYQTDTILLFDEIVFFVKGNLGPSVGGNLKDRYITIRRNGEIITFFGSGFNKFKMDSTEFERIERLFKKADMKTLIDNYYREYTDNSDFVSSSITLIKGNKVVFSCENAVDKINTKEFLWAYLSALFCPDYNQLEICNTYGLYSYHLDIPEIFFWYTGFLTENSVLELYGSERFYIRNLINNASKTDQDFSPYYTLRNLIVLKKDYSIIPKFKTDGRFYQYQNKDKHGKTVTLDLGFNFIEENNLTNQFRKR